MMMNAQQIFDKVATHLAAQKFPSRDNGHACRYRSQSGYSCAVGCLIPDSHYRPEFDSSEQLSATVSQVPDMWDVPREHWISRWATEPELTTDIAALQHYHPFTEALAAGGVDLKQHAELLAELQWIHDTTEPCYNEKTAQRLRNYAAEHGLNSSAVVDVV